MDDASDGAGAPRGPDQVIELLWIPLGAGAGGALVRWSGWLYEAIAARVRRRARSDLYHSAIRVHLDGRTTTIEMAPVWVTRGERGVVVEGAVGMRWLGRYRLFRYEVRRWVDGTIPDAPAAVGGPIRVPTNEGTAARLLDLVPGFPTFVWGRDELDTGDMWNSNSLVSWLLVRAGVDVAHLGPPAGGRAPGWDAGRVSAEGRRAVRP